MLAQKQHNNDEREACFFEVIPSLQRIRTENSDREKERKEEKERGRESVREKQKKENGKKLER